MQSCLTSEWLECLGCIHSLGLSWHQTGTFGAQDLFLKIMFSPWISMWSQTYVRPKQEAGLIIVIGMQVVPYQGPPLQHLGFNFLLSPRISNKKIIFNVQPIRDFLGYFDIQVEGNLGKVMALWSSDPFRHHVGPRPKHLSITIMTWCLEYLDVTLISGWRVFPSVARYSESATSDWKVPKKSQHST